jgi:hypothetical protein
MIPDNCVMIVKVLRKRTARENAEIEAESKTNTVKRPRVCEPKTKPK